MKSFAGFWRDGEVVKPEARHFDCDDCLIARHKDNASLDICISGYKDWHSVYWLDTTAPTELSPQEAFECHKVIWPSAKKIIQSHDGYYFDCGSGKAIINWGNTTEYPSKQKWRVPTDADKGKKCLFWDDGDEYGDKGQGVFLGVHYKGGFLVSKEDEPIHVWSRCEVQDEN